MPSSLSLSSLLPPSYVHLPRKQQQQQQQQLKTQQYDPSMIMMSKMSLGGGNITTATANDITMDGCNNNNNYVNSNNGEEGQLAFAYSTVDNGTVSGLNENIVLAEGKPKKTKKQWKRRVINLPIHSNLY